MRIIPRLDIKGSHLIKGIHLEGLRKVGDPNEFAKKYYENGADELVYMDIVASLYNRNNLTEVVERAAKDIFIPMTVGGGIRSSDDVTQLLNVGADKVAINTAAVKNKAMLTEMAEKFGSQCIVLSIEAKRHAKGWEAMTDNGREHTGLDVVQWAMEAVSLGAGEIFLTSIDQEGTCKGFDIELVNAVSKAVDVPVIASGGMGNLDDFSAVIERGSADAVSMAHVLHYNKFKIQDIRDYAEERNLL